MLMPEPRSFLPTAHALADLARPIAKKYFRQPLDVQTKSDASPVTIADQEIEAAMVSYIRRNHPDHGILGEEHGSVNAGAPWTWVLDPIDGTKSFVMGRPTFGTLIALAFEGKPVLGIIDQPILGERWVGCEGTPTTFNDAPCRVRACENLSDAVAATTTPAMFKGREDVLARLTKETKSLAFGGDCYAYAMLASGFVDLVVEADLKPYDFMAVVPVVQGAGGVMTDWEGGALHIASRGEVVAAGAGELQCVFT
jgi:inositol-phosphate phosphatase / L-galactose 1-phosphate phosphatase / histidinol-phosphatase